MKTQFHYKNHHGQVELRTVDVISLDYVASPHLDYGYGPGWFLHCLDYSRGRNGDPRSFALSNIQMNEFKHGTKGGVPAFRIFLDGLDAALGTLKVNGQDVRSAPEHG